MKKKDSSCKIQLETKFRLKKSFGINSKRFPLIRGRKCSFRGGGGGGGKTDETQKKKDSSCK